MRREFAEAWVKALRSGKYKQGVGKLFDGELHCCLGVACEVAGLTPVPSTDFGEFYVTGIHAYGLDGEQNHLPREVSAMIDSYGDCGRRRDNKAICINGKCFRSLIHANDGGVTFEDISDYIENNWEML